MQLNQTKTRGSDVALECELTGAKIIHVWRIGFPQPRDVIAGMKANLSEAETARAGKFVSAADADQFTVLHGALRALLAGITGEKPAAIRVESGKNGKPFVAGSESRSPHFSLSHTKGMGLVCISEAESIGVDVEFMNTDFPFREIAGSHFSADENAALQALPEDEQRGVFFAAWVRKEAWIKALGWGLDSVGGLDVRLGQPLIEGASLREPARGTEDGPVWIQDVDVGPYHAGAVAIRGNHRAVQVSDWSLEAGMSGV